MSLNLTPTVSGVRRSPPGLCDPRESKALHTPIGLDDADVGHHGVVHLALSLFARLEAFNQRIPTPPQCQIDPLQDDVMDF
jgi:hypothetical protein